MRIGSSDGSGLSNRAFTGFARRPSSRVSLNRTVLYSDYMCAHGRHSRRFVIPPLPRYVRARISVFAVALAGSNLIRSRGYSLEARSTFRAINHCAQANPSVYPTIH